MEDSPGPVVEQQFGEFKTWTQASHFATKLNEGLDLDPIEVRQIVTSSLLATACILQEALKTQCFSSDVKIATRAVQLRFVLAELSLALSFCRSASLLSTPVVRRALLARQKALDHAAYVLRFFGGDDRELNEIVSRTRELDAVLQPLVSSLRSSSLNQSQCWPDDVYRTRELKHRADLRNQECALLLSVHT